MSAGNYSAFFWISSSRTSVRMSPNQLKPLQVVLSVAIGLFGLSPIPQMQSYGLASTMVVPAVDSKSSDSCSFCKN